jgi:hypothetical protein
MKQLVATLCALMIALPAPLFAQDLGELLKDQPELEFVPKPTPEQCGDAKCFDLEDFKLYLQMRTQYVWLFKVHTGTMPALVLELKKIGETNQELAETHKKRGDRWEGAYNDIFPKYVKSVKQAERAKGMSVFGGGFVWLIVAGVTGIALGLAGGIWVSK